MIDDRSGFSDAIFWVGAAGAFPTVSGLAAASEAEALITIISELHPAHRDGAIWAMNRNTESVCRRLKDADGRWLLKHARLRAVDGIHAAGIRVLRDPFTTKGRVKFFARPNGPAVTCPHA